MDQEPAKPPVDMDRVFTAVHWLARGYSYEEVATKVGSSPEKLRGLMGFFGLKGRAVPNGARRFDVVASADAVGLIEAASGLRCMNPLEIVEKVVNIVFCDPALLKNILDDGRDVK